MLFRFRWFQARSLTWLPEPSSATSAVSPPSSSLSSSSSSAADEEPPVRARMSYWSARAESDRLQETAYRMQAPTGASFMPKSWRCRR